MAPVLEHFVGEVLSGRYAVERLLGYGGMAVVLLGRDQKLGGAPVAIKVPLPEILDNETLKRQTSLYEPHIEPSSELREFGLVPTIAVRFRVAVDASADIELDSLSELQATVQGPASEPFKAVCGEDGIYVATGLPPGAWPIRVTARLRGKHPFIGRATGSAGEVPTVALKPR